MEQAGPMIQSVLSWVTAAAAPAQVSHMTNGAGFLRILIAGSMRVIVFPAEGSGQVAFIQHSIARAFPVPEFCRHKFPQRALSTLSPCDVEGDSCKLQTGGSHGRILES